MFKETTTTKTTYGKEPMKYFKDTTVKITPDGSYGDFTYTISEDPDGLSMIQLSYEDGHTKGLTIAMDSDAARMIAQTLVEFAEKLDSKK